MGSFQEELLHGCFLFRLGEGPTFLLQSIIRHGGLILGYKACSVSKLLRGLTFKSLQYGMYQCDLLTPKTTPIIIIFRQITRSFYLREQ